MIKEIKKSVEIILQVEGLLNVSKLISARFLAACSYIAMEKGGQEERGVFKCYFLLSIVVAVRSLCPARKEVAGYYH
jgi:hypothetical protein